MIQVADSPAERCSTSAWPDSRRTVEKTIEGTHISTCDARGDPLGIRP